VAVAAISRDYQHRRVRATGNYSQFPADRRREGALAANSAPEAAKAPEAEARAAVRVQRIVKLSVGHGFVSVTPEQEIQPME
jgi:hypothetical protein